MKTVHHNIRITGKVQGVGFRETTKYFADQAGVKGFVRNESDGSVYIEAEAELWELESFTEWCNEGPDRAKVTGCEVEPSEELKHFKDFVILKK